MWLATVLQYTVMCVLYGRGGLLLYYHHPWWELSDGQKRSFILAKHHRLCPQEGARVHNNTGAPVCGAAFTHKSWRRLHSHSLVNYSNFLTPNRWLCFSMLICFRRVKLMAAKEIAETTRIGRRAVQCNIKNWKIVGDHDLQRRNVVTTASRP